MRSERRRALRFASFLLLVLPAFAHAWGPAGHRIVATLAERELTATTRREVQYTFG